MITAEVAIYPLKTNNASGVINNSINVLNNANVNYDVNSMNTKITGTKEEIFQNLHKMYDEAERSGGEINMVVTMSNASS